MKSFLLGLTRSSIIISTSVLLFSYINCSLIESEEEQIPFLQMEQQCMDKVSNGGTLNVVIRNQTQYDHLIYNRFEKPLADYWNTHYESVFQSVIEQHFGLTVKQYDSLVSLIFYSSLPFKGTENCSHPEIDFSKSTLLGVAAHASGCENPTYDIKYSFDPLRLQYTLKIEIGEFGTCSMGISKNIWVLVPKIDGDYSVNFERTYVKH